jgi:hypothetical protein
MRIIVRLRSNVSLFLKLTSLQQNENASTQFGSDLPDQA